MRATANEMYKIFQKILKETLEDTKKPHIKNFAKDDFSRQINKCEYVITLLQKHKMVLEARGDYDSVPEHGLIHLDTKISSYY